MEGSVVTVGNRATLPSIFMENEYERNSSGQSHLRLRNPKSNDRARTKLNSHEDSANSTFISIRSTPSYGTPGTSRNFSDFESPDSGFHGARDRYVNDDLAKQKGVPGNENLDGSYVSHHVSDVSGVGVSLRSSPFEQARIKASLRELQSRWRHHQRRAAIHGLKDSVSDFWHWMSDLDTTKEVMPIIVTAIIIASCVVTFMLLSSGLRHNLEMAKVPAGANGKYDSIAFGNKKLKERYRHENRVLPSTIQDENGDLLGGKKASIQFAHDIKMKLESQPPRPEPSPIVFETPQLEGDEEESKGSRALKEALAQNQGDQVLEELSSKVAAKVANMISGSGDPEKDKLLQKLSKFGHFTTTKVNMKEQDPLPETKESLSADKNQVKEARLADQTVEKVKKIKKVQSQTPNEAPFRIHRELPMTSKTDKKVEDDPFRGKSNSKVESSPPDKKEVELNVEPVKKVSCKHEKSASN